MTSTSRRWLLALSLAALGTVPACTKVYTDRPDPTAPTPVVVTPAPVPVPRADKIEFRVLGLNIASVPPVIMRHTDATNGLTLYSGGVPYFVQFDSFDNSVFLYIEAQATGLQSTSTLQVQIFVNGKLFREAYSSGFILSTSASGTFRR